MSFMKEKASKIQKIDLEDIGNTFNTLELNLLGQKS